MISKDLFTQEPYLIVPDALYTLATKPISVSLNGEVVLYEQLVVLGSGDTYRTFLSQQTLSENIIININSVVSGGNPELVKIDNVVPNWEKNQYLVSYQDLSDPISSLSGSNKLALIENDDLKFKDLVFDVTGEVANASLVNFAFSPTSDFEIYLDTSANNISTDPSDLDTNGVRDIYKIDFSLNTLERISLSTGLEADQHVKLVGVTEANNGSDIIIFETIANTFSNQDTNDLFDIYQLSTNQNSSDLSLVSISTQNNASGIVNEQVLIENGSIYFVSSNAELTNSDPNITEDIFKFDLSNGSVERVSKFFDNQVIESNVEYLLHDISYTGDLLVTISNSGIESYDDQIVSIDSNSNEIKLISEINGSQGNDLSLEANSSSNQTGLGVIAYYTTSTNLGTAPNSTIIQYQYLNISPSIQTAASINIDEDKSSPSLYFDATDPDGDILSYSFSDPSKGSVTNNQDGTYTYTPNANENGNDSFTLTVSDGTESVSQLINVTINSLDDAPTGSVMVSGLAQQGQTLTADTSTLSDADGLGTLSYQWKADGTDINGATSSSYTLTQEDVSKIVTVVINYTDNEGTPESILSLGTNSVTFVVNGHTIEPNANLEGANLSGANLENAKLSGADLTGANLSNTQLNGANLTNADLKSANLSGAYLGNVNLSGANLNGTNLSGAKVNLEDWDLLSLEQQEVAILIV